MKNGEAIAALATSRKFMTFGKFVVLTAFGLCQPPIATAQTADSLATLLATAPADTHRVKILNELAWKINESETDRAETKIHEAITLAQKLNFKAGEATAWNGLGVVEEIRGNYKLAIEHYEKALALRQSLGDRGGVAGIHTNLGNAYESLGKLPEAVSQHRESLSIYETLKDTVRVARAYTNISALMSTSGAYSEAFGELNKARLLIENNRDSSTRYKIYTQLGHNRYDLDMFDKAREWYQQSLQLRQQVGDSFDIADGLVDLANALDELGSEDSSSLAVQYYLQALDIFRAAEERLSIAKVCNNLGDAYKHLKRYPEALKVLRESERICLELDDQPDLLNTYNTLNDVFSRLNKPKESLRYIQLYAGIAEKIGNENYKLSALKDFARAYAQLGDYAKAYGYAKQYNESRFKAMDDKRAQNIETQQALTSVKEREQALDREKADATLRKAELDRVSAIRNALLGGAVLLVLLVGLLFSRNRIRARANRLLTAQNATIERERQRADTLLQNILPEKTAEELKTYGTVKPVHYESVTVLFSDFKNFTTIAESLSPETLVKELDEHFRLFDAIVARHGLEKIKTIGDAYMCAGGLPEPNKTHALDTVRAALEMQQTLRKLAAKKAAIGKPFFEMRIGINTGPVVAGVVGSHKFAYDIWGDTVNTAARLEQGGEAGKINISETTWEKVRDEFPCTFRGKLPAKNKGEIAMYFVEG
ncbi:MAG: tetratricopeptide repeat protein [Phycisphaerae bacterium]|nr:tetratricopeptide repeat protein [Saprospiraceae bacterium]